MQFKIALLAIIAMCTHSCRTVVVQKESPGLQPVAEAESALLSAGDKADLALVLRLKRLAGDHVWPGFGRAKIPIILYDDHFEFLTGLADPPAPWLAVAGDSFAGQVYFRRPARSPQAFAVAVDGRWAGRFCTLAKQASFPMKLGRDFHVIAILHEAFHAFQATRAADRFAAALAAYKLEDRYPKNDAAFAAAWNNEGAILAKALQAAAGGEPRELGRQFLQARATRRAMAALTPELVAYERDLEWLEGLAKYAEIRFYELAAARAAEPDFADFGSGLPFYLKSDFWRLERMLGQQQGDLRYYLSGMAQARLLDRLQPGWKRRFSLGRSSLEDGLRAAAIKADRSAPDVSVPEKK